jgi:acetyltransferase-like isoleucine patch superfamily enzyme
MKRHIVDKIDEILILEGKLEPSMLDRVKFALNFSMRYFFERLAYFSRSNRFRVWCYRRMGVNIGKGAFVGNYIIFDRIFPSMVFIGDHTSIGDSTVITAHANIPSKTPLKKLYPRSMKKTVIGKGIWIMPNCVVAPGVIIGDYSVIATGAIITKDIPPMVLAGGLPAKVLKDLSPQLKGEIPEEEFNRLKSLQ